MSILTTTADTPAATGDDGAAIRDLEGAFDAQRQAFAADRYPTLAERRERIGALVGALVGNRARIGEALSCDFGHHPAGASDLIEMLGIVGRAQYVLEHLEEWMAPQPREVDPAALGNARAFVRQEPKGVVGNIVPWNFPIDIALGPLAEMLGAGNRVIIKPSEYAPACAELVAEMVRSAFDPDLVHVAVGGLAMSKAFAALPWDHLLYTGSPDVGRQVMAAAAANLTPVTLELGGKCPAVLTPGSVTPEAVESVIGTKIIKNGQMCISVDYALVPRGDMEELHRPGPRLYGPRRAQLLPRPGVYGHHLRPPSQPADRYAAGGRGAPDAHRGAGGQSQSGSGNTPDAVVARHRAGR